MELLALYTLIFQAAGFPAVPGMKQIYADALNDKFDSAAQASAQA